ncbi:helix-turn-helix domain-containing protein [Aurantiacibacter luteus]|uniref:helix-turn-helix domain-containing protein n=1 Tax=Aurantiacibacter luteus TaxID=1581420 RepID=UPI0009E2E3A8
MVGILVCEVNVSYYLSEAAFRGLSLYHPYGPTVLLPNKRQRDQLGPLEKTPGGPPIAVGVAEAQRLLSVSRTTVFDLMRANELDTFRCGRRRLILLSSIHAYVERRVAFDG